MKLSALLSALLLISNPVARAQESSELGIVRGQVTPLSGALATGLIVEVRNLSDHGAGQRVRVNPDGTFEFRSLGAGEYEATVQDEERNVIQRSFVHVGTSHQPLILQLPEPIAAPRLSGTGTVSTKELLHPIPSKARREFLRSDQAFRAGDIRKSMAHLEKAIDIHPDYMEAHNNLGSRYVALDQYDKALTEFQKTVELDPNSQKGYLNLSLALSALKRYGEAEAAARRAVELDPNSIPAHYALGRALAGEKQDTPEALENLRMATGQFPNARLFVAWVLARQGALDEAASELREYLKSPGAERRQFAEEWLARLSRPAAQ